MTNYRTIDDVEKDKEKREREELKEKAVDDIKDFMGKLFPKKEKKKLSFLKIIGLLILGLFCITIILGCVWLLKFFIQGIF